MNIFEYYQSNKITYNKGSLQMKMLNTNEVDVSIIIPVMNRESFNKPLTEHLLSAIKKHPSRTFSITFVEHSTSPKHDVLCTGNVNHIWSPSGNGIFNKCYAFNLGALFSNKCKYYMFHDIDIIMQDDFFDKLFQNLEHHKTSIQCFNGRRVVYLDDDTTNRVINKSIDINKIVIDNVKVKPATPGAPGGSIFMKYEDFYKVGGFDAEFFWGYSCEDAFFYNKVDMTSGMNSANSPIIELFHMMHPPMYSTNKDIKFHLDILKTFNELSQDDKNKLMELESNNLKKYINHV